MHFQSSVCKYQFFTSIMSLSSQLSDLSKSWPMWQKVEFFSGHVKKVKSKKVKSPESSFFSIKRTLNILNSVKDELLSTPRRLRGVFWTGSSRNCGAMEPFRAHPLHTLVRNQKLQTSPKLHPVCVHIFVYLFMFLNLFSLLLAKLPFLKAQPDGTDTAKSRPFTHVTTTSQAGLQLVVATTTEHRTSSVFGLQRIDSSTDPVGIRGRSRWHNDSWRVNGLCQVVDLRNCPQRIVCRVS